MFVISAGSPKLMRAGPVWHLQAADAFYIVPTTKSTTEITEEAVDTLLEASRRMRPREIVACGWFVRAVGRAWTRPELVGHLRTALLDGPAALTRRMSPAHTGPRSALARVRAAWAALTGEGPT